MNSHTNKIKSNVHEVVAFSTKQLRITFSVSVLINTVPMTKLGLINSVTVKTLHLSFLAV